MSVDPFKLSVAVISISSTPRAGMKKLRDHNKDSALIIISQSKKEGKMCGSYEIVYDSDMAVKVENGVATTTKNRFKEKGIEFKVF